MKKIAVGDLGEFWYGDYKEPFEQLEGAVPGHPVGVVLKAGDGKLLCAFCGKTYDGLGRHVRMHGLTARSYKIEVGLLQKSALTSERLRITGIARGMAHARHPAFIRARYLRRGSVGANAEIRHAGLRTPERLNMTGRCYAQVLAVARTVIAERGRLTHAGLARHGVRRGMWQPYFPTIEALAQASGGRSGVQYWSDGQLLDGLRGLAATIGRTPADSDLRRYGLPWPQTYGKRFGSYVAACTRAGLVPNVPAPLDGQLEVAILSAYATNGSTRRTAELVHVGTLRVLAVLARYGIPLVPGGASHRDRMAIREQAAEVARRLAGWPEEEPAA